MLSKQQTDNLVEIAKYHDGEWVEVSYQIKYKDGGVEISYLSVMPVKEKKEWE
jgi:hypothetical protein